MRSSLRYVSLILAFTLALGVLPVPAAAATAPDLKVVDIWTDPASPVGGQAATVKYSVKNQGDTAAGPFTTTLIIEGSESSTNVAGLAAGSTTTYSTSNVVQAAGAHLVRVVTDSNSQVTETNEGNNERQETITWNGAPPAPDLVVLDVWTDPTSPVGGQAATVWFAVKNQGAGAAGSFRSKLYIDGSQYASVDWAGLAAGSQKSFNTPNVVQSAGAHTLRAVVDSQGQVAESNEGNNERQTTVAWSGAGPVLSSVSCDSCVADSQLHTVTLSGSGFASTNTLTFTAPGGNTYSSTTYPARFRFVSSSQITYDINPSTTSGTWSVRVNAQDGQQSATRTFTVSPVPPPPGPVLSSVSPTSYVADSTNHAMTLTGTGFVSGAIPVFVDPVGTTIPGNPSKTTFNSASQLTYQFNAGTAAGSWSVKIKNPDGTMSGTKPFTATETTTPDLVVLDIWTEPASPIGGQAVTVKYSVSNQGNLAAGSFRTKLYIDGSEAASTDVTGLAAGSTTTYSTPNVMQSGGAHTLRVVADTQSQIAESNEANNERQETLGWIHHDAADLAVEAIWTDSASPAGGQAVTVKYSVKNQGNFAAGSFRTKLVIDGSEAASTDVTGLAAGSTTTYSTPNVVQAGGAHTLRVVADTQSQVAESNEGNNELQKSITWTSITAPDLVILDIWTEPASLIGGQAVTVKYSVKNQGDAAAGSFRTKLYIDGSEAASTDVTGLAAESTTTYSTANVVQSGGAHTLRVVADSSSQVAESNEGNNEHQETITWSSGPTTTRDLIVEDIWTDPASPVGGSAATVTVRVKNIGDASSGAFRARLLIDGREQSIGDGPNLAPGAWNDFNTLNVVKPAGSHTLLVIADSLNQVAESNEGNNERQETITWSEIPNSLPDLVVNGISFEPNPPVAGQSVAVTCTYSNSPNAASTQSGFGVQVSIDGGTPKTTTSGALLPGQTDSRTFTFTEAYSAGSHSVVCEVNKDRAAAESNYENSGTTIVKAWVDDAWPATQPQPDAPPEDAPREDAPLVSPARAIPAPWKGGGHFDLLDGTRSNGQTFTAVQVQRNGEPAVHGWLFWQENGEVVTNPEKVAELARAAYGREVFLLGADEQMATLAFQDEWWQMNDLQWASFKDGVLQRSASTGGNLVGGCIKGAKGGVVGCVWGAEAQILKSVVVAKAVDKAVTHAMAVAGIENCQASLESLLDDWEVEASMNASRVSSLWNVWKSPSRAGESATRYGALSVDRYTEMWLGYVASISDSQAFFYLRGTTQDARLATALFDFASGVAGGLDVTELNREGLGVVVKLYEKQGGCREIAEAVAYRAQVESQLAMDLHRVTAESQAAAAALVPLTAGVPTDAMRHVGVIVQVAQSEPGAKNTPVTATPRASDGALEIRVDASNSSPGNLRLQVSSSSHQGRLVVVNAEAGLFDTAGKGVAVWLDAQPVPKARDYADLLSDSSTTGSAKYLVVQGATGNQFLIWIPHFSNRTIEIAAIPAVEDFGQAFVTPIGILAMAAAAVVLAAGAYGLGRRRARGVALVPPEPSAASIDGPAGETEMAPDWIDLGPLPTGLSADVDDGPGTPATRRAPKKRAKKKQKPSRS